MIAPPTTRKDLFARLVDIVRHGEYDMPTARYMGTGAPGIYLEDLLGHTKDNPRVLRTLALMLETLI